MMQHGFQKLCVFAFSCGQARFEAVARGHQLVEFRDYALLFEERRHRNRDTPKISKADSNKRHAVVMCCGETLTSWRVQIVQGKT